jgi:hypothetical protein
VTRSARPAPRVVLMVPAGVAMLIGVDAGLSLLGVWSSGSGARAEAHGLLMVLGFVGTLVSLERAVALRHPAAYSAPLLLGAGALGQVVPGAAQVGGSLLVGGAAALCLVYVPLWRRQRDEAVLVSAGGAVLALGGVLLVIGDVDLSVAVPWLAGFVVLTIAGERLELARLAMSARATPLLLLAAAAVALSVATTTLWPATGTRLLGVALLGLTAWLVAHDVSRRTLRATGLPRYVATCMVAAQVWLAVAGATWLTAGPVASGPAYDAVVHAVFLGFTLSMVMAHAPMILPAVTRVPLPYRPTFYVPWLLLQVSLIVRLYAGDALGSETARQVGGAGNALALLAFVGVVVHSAVAAAPVRRAAPPTGGTTDDPTGEAADRQVVGA